jgi:hypothetical protein
MGSKYVLIIKKENPSMLEVLLLLFCLLLECNYNVNGRNALDYGDQIVE